MIYDVCIVLIMLIAVFSGYKKGILRTALGIAGMVAAFVLAFIFSSRPMCERVYDSIFHETIYSYTETAVENAKEELRGKLREEVQSITHSYIDEYLGGSEFLKKKTDELADKSGNAVKAFSDIADFLEIDVKSLLTNPLISGKIEIIAETYGGSAAEKINSRLPPGIKVKEEQVKSFIKDKEAEEALIYELFGVSSRNSEAEGLAAYIERAVVKPVMLRFIGAVLWASVYAAVRLAVRIITGVILAVRKIDLIKGCDSALGGVLGAVKGAAAVLVFCAAVVFITRLTGGTEYMNEEYYKSTFVFKYIYLLISNLL